MQTTTSHHKGVRIEHIRTASGRALTHVTAPGGRFCARVYEMDGGLLVQRATLDFDSHYAGSRAHPFGADLRAALDFAVMYCHASTLVPIAEPICEPA